MATTGTMEDAIVTLVNEDFEDADFSTVNFGVEAKYGTFEELNVMVGFALDYSGIVGTYDKVCDAMDFFKTEWHLRDYFGHCNERNFAIHIKNGNGTRGLIYVGWNNAKQSNVIKCSCSIKNVVIKALYNAVDKSKVQVA